jgi:hypothetical protein
MVLSDCDSGPNCSRDLQVVLQRTALKSASQITLSLPPPIKGGDFKILSLVGQSRDLAGFQPAGGLERPPHKEGGGFQSDSKARI